MAYYDDSGNDGQPFGRGQGGIQGPRRPSMFVEVVLPPARSSS